MKRIEIVLCIDCNGSGEEEHEECTDYHRGEYRYWYTPCRRCSGTGRLKKTTDITFEPFG
jgi:DnaJ-class molecular chaperone